VNIPASWLERKKASLCVLAGICAVSLCAILMSGGQTGAGGGSYAVSIRHYGIDAREMERSISMPLEDALFAIPGVRGVQSCSENGLSRVFVAFDRNSRGQYEMVREAAQRVYETLPSSVQRPEIQSSGNSRIPVWSAAVFDIGSDDVAANENGVSIVDTALFLERIVKPRLESLGGAGEVLVSGTGIREIIIALDQEKSAALGLDPSAVASAMAVNDALFSGGILEYRNREIIVTVDGRLGPAASSMFENRVTDSLSALEKALIPLGGGKTAVLGEIALVFERERPPDILSRLNGKKTATISIMGSSGADLRKLSGEVQKELAALSLPLRFTVLLDRGAEEAAAFRSVFGAALQSAFMVGLICFLLNRKKLSSLAAERGPQTLGLTVRRGMPDFSTPLRMQSGGLPPGNDPAGFFCALAIPVVCLVSTALLAITGFPPNRPILAGIAVGIGSAADPVILCAEKLRRSRNYDEARLSLKQLWGPLASGAATTAAALLPLQSISAEPGIIARAISVITLAALVLSLVFLPPLLLWNTGSSAAQNRFLSRLPGAFPRGPALNLAPLLFFSGKFFRRSFRRLCRFLAVITKLCVNHPFRLLLAAIIVSAAAVLALLAGGADPEVYGSENSLYAQVEFEGGLLAEEADRLLAKYAETLSAHEGITHIETGARTGAGNLLVSFEPALISADRVRELVRSTAIPGGFVFINDVAANEHYWEIKIFGDDDTKCRELAGELAWLVSADPMVNEQVFNFKEGSKKLTLLPDRERLIESGIAFSRAADTVRRSIYGPVSYKKTLPQGEIDVRVRAGTRIPLRTEIPEILIAHNGRENGGAVNLDSLTRTKEGVEPAAIRREDRRRMASITIGTGVRDPRRVKKAMARSFEKLELPSGYSVEFDPDAIRRADALSKTGFSLILALLFCYMVIASVNESFTVPLVVLSAVPPSLALPALCLVLSGHSLNLASVCAFTAVSGMTVNAAVLCAAGINSLPCSGKKEPALILYRVLREKMPALLATTGTTVAGALPFLLLRERANDLIRTLSLVTALGVTASCLCSISVVPALSLISGLFRNPVVRRSRSFSGQGITKPK
jgi:multidrug efflux pump subunit AcrB